MAASIGTPKREQGSTTQGGELMREAGVGGMSMSELKVSMQRLSQLVDEACVQRPQNFDEPANVADLGCAEVELVISLKNNDPPFRFRAIVQEASPGGCPNLCKAVADHVQANGFPGVEVVTEW